MQETVQFVLRYGYAILFASVLAEQLGLPLPASPVLLAMGALAGIGHFSLALALLLAVIASVLADTVWYWLGRRRGYKILNLLCKISLEPDSCVRRTSDIFTRYGPEALLFAKFVPGLSTVAPPMAGLIRMPLWRFLLNDGGGALAWAGAFAGLGFVFRTQLERVAEKAMSTGAGIMILVIAVVGGWVGWKFFQRARFLRKLRVARITPDELHRKMQDGDAVLIVDLRDARELASDAARLPGAIHVPLDQLESRHENIPRDREIILYCS
ncbi:MAG: VTT domain-containing protein [Candidatus Solibacter usitatus]|nr:VTT domain-containing protein [Candidatus Solibacter usitatus]